MNISGFTEIRANITDLTYGNWTEVVIQPPTYGPGLVGYAAFLTTLIPIALLTGLAARGSTAQTGIGLFTYGIVILALPVMGLTPPNWLLISTLSILLGIVLVFFS